MEVSGRTTQETKSSSYRDGGVLMSMDTAMRNKNHFYYLSSKGAKPAKKNIDYSAFFASLREKCFNLHFKFTMHRLITTFNLN